MVGYPGTPEELRAPDCSEDHVFLLNEPSSSGNSQDGEQTWSLRLLIVRLF